MTRAIAESDGRNDLDTDGDGKGDGESSRRGRRRESFRNHWMKPPHTARFLQA